METFTKEQEHLIMLGMQMALVTMLENPILHLAPQHIIVALVVDRFDQHRRNNDIAGALEQCKALFDHARTFIATEEFKRRAPDSSH